MTALFFTQILQIEPVGLSVCLQFVRPNWTDGTRACSYAAAAVDDDACLAVRLSDRPFKLLLVNRFRVFAFRS